MDFSFAIPCFFVEVMRLDATAITALVNSFGEALVSVSQSLGVSVTIDKANVKPGVNAPGSRLAASVGFVTSDVQGTVAVMINEDSFSQYVAAMSGGMLKPDVNDPVALSVIGEFANMVGGHATMKVSSERIDLTPPQLFVGHEIKAVSFQGESVKSFTVPFKVEGNGMVFLVLAIHE